MSNVCFWANLRDTVASTCVIPKGVFHIISCLCNTSHWTKAVQAVSLCSISIAKHSNHTHSRLRSLLDPMSTLLACLAFHIHTVFNLCIFGFRRSVFFFYISEFICYLNNFNIHHPNVYTFQFWFCIRHGIRYGPFDMIIYIPIYNVCNSSFALEWHYILLFLDKELF